MTLEKLWQIQALLVIAVVHFFNANFTATIRQRLGIAPNGGDLVSAPKFNEKWCLGDNPFFWEGNFSGASLKCPTNSGLAILQFAQMNVLILVRMVRFQFGITHKSD